MWMVGTDLTVVPQRNSYLVRYFMSCRPRTKMIVKMASVSGKPCSSYTHEDFATHHLHPFTQRLAHPCSLQPAASTPELVTKLGCVTYHAWQDVLVPKALPWPMPGRGTPIREVIFMQLGTAANNGI